MILREAVHENDGVAVNAIVPHCKRLTVAHLHHAHRAWFKIGAAHRAGFQPSIAAQLNRRDNGMGLLVNFQRAVRVRLLQQACFAAADHPALLALPSLVERKENPEQQHR